MENLFLHSLFIQSINETTYKIINLFEKQFEHKSFNKTIKKLD